MMRGENAKGTSSEARMSPQEGVRSSLALGGTWVPRGAE